LLHHENLHFFSAPQAEAGFALLRTGSVTGVSNVVPRRADAQTVWSDVVTLAGLTCPGLDLVGYEHGPDLTAALAAGFAETGPLRVWLR
ncbi:MAG TPA: hypothetical protein VEQ66_03415, partial [Propionibacteriaceae bacterium]|nr:hypothetical protein [Propionibacteriaceae bacterium]